MAGDESVVILDDSVIIVETYSSGNASVIWIDNSDTEEEIITDRRIGLPAELPIYDEEMDISDTEEEIIKPCMSVFNKPKRCDPACLSDAELTDYLKTMKQIIFLDIDNWSGFFKKLPGTMPPNTFIWTFYGGQTQWCEPRRSEPFLHLKRDGCFLLHDRCGKTKDAADFAIVLQVGKMDERLPKTVHFIILSGDKGFVEVERQFSKSSRWTMVLDPHHQTEKTVYTIFKNIACL